jgi:hypothetical protein
MTAEDHVNVENREAGGEKYCILYHVNNLMNTVHMRSRCGGYQCYSLYLSQYTI